MAARQPELIQDSKARLVGERYVRLVQSLPEVRQVLLEQAPPGPRLWTVIAAEPFDDAPREAVYEAELRAMQGRPSISMNFRLINLREFPPASHASLVPATAEILFQR